MLAQPVFEVSHQLRFCGLGRRGGRLANSCRHKKIPEMLGAEKGVMITPPAFVPRTSAGPEVLAERRQVDADPRIAHRRRKVVVAERQRVIMLTFYVIEIESSAGQDRLLADAAGHSARDKRQYPRL